jgi:choline dehydrogenase-like flavoprotein
MKRIAIVGSGIVGTALACRLVEAGHRVDVFESGPDIPYPHTPQYEDEVLYKSTVPPPPETDRAQLPERPAGISQTGDYGGDIGGERVMCVGGQATRWFGISPRFVPASFRSKTLHGYADDWPITYDDLEPYYGAAEKRLAISGSSTDNPFAAPRSTGFPLPPFEPAHKDVELARRLKARGIVVHTTPQARTRLAIDGRPACENFGVCQTCPTGARYSPNHHLRLAEATGRLTVHANAHVRRILMKGKRATGLVYHKDHAAASSEHPADIVIIAAGGLESARLLLLSEADGPHSNGIGNVSGLVGRNLIFHHVWRAHMEFAEKMMAGGSGPPTLLSHQFANPPGWRNFGGVGVELFDNYGRAHLAEIERTRWTDGESIVAALEAVTRCRSITFHGEASPGPGKYVELNGAKDRFGDPSLHAHYELDEFDYETYAFAESVGAQMAGALGADAWHIDPIELYWSAHHHLGTCRMGETARDSVVDPFGAVHETAGLYVCGGSTFVTATSYQPTLTMVALALRTAAYIRDGLER